MWPHRWLTPVSGLAHAAARPSPTPAPTSRHPTRPGPRVTASRSTSAGLAPAFSKARSISEGSRTRWSRAASSGTTPPNSLCTSTWVWMTLLRTRRPSSTSATEVSSHEVSMPRISPTAPPALRATSPLRGEDALLGKEVAAEALDLGLDPLQVGLERLAEARRVDRVRPHYDRVLAVVGVVALAPADDLEAEALVELHRVVVAGADLQGHPLGAHVVSGLDQAGKDDPAVAMVLEVSADANGRHVRLVVHAPHAAVTDDRRVEVGDAISGRPLGRTILAQHHVVRAGARGELAVVGVARPGRREDLALDLLDRVHVRLAHQLQRELLPDLDHLNLPGKRLHVFDFEITIRHFAGRFEKDGGRIDEAPELVFPLEPVAGCPQRVAAGRPAHQRILGRDFGWFAHPGRAVGQTEIEPPPPGVCDRGDAVVASRGLQVQGRQGNYRDATAHGQAYRERDPHPESGEGAGAGHDRHLGDVFVAHDLAEGRLQLACAGGDQGLAALTVQCCDRRGRGRRVNDQDHVWS